MDVPFSLNQIGLTAHFPLLDTTSTATNRPAVPRLLKLVALFLATLWLPATLHCQLEGLGIDALFACASQHDEAAHSDQGGCTDDGCQTIESGQVVVTKSRIYLDQPPALLATGSFCLFLLALPAPAQEIFAVAQDEMLPLQRTWQFARRAALPARAPDTLSV